MWILGLKELSGYQVLDTLSLAFYFKDMKENRMRERR